MKLVRPLLLTLAILVALLALACCVAFVPAVQQWAVRRALASHPEVQLDFASFAASPSRVRLAGVRFQRAGLVVTVEQAEAEFSAWQFLAHRHLRIDRLAVAGTVIDATKLSADRAQAGAASAPVAAPGALGRVQLPWTVQLGDVSIVGRAMLPAGPGRASLTADFQINGGGIAPEQEGALLLKARVTDPTPAARVTALRADGRLVVHESADRAFDRATLTLALDAEGPQFTGGHQLKLVASMQSGAGAEKISLALDTQQAGRTANLLQIDAALPVNAPEGVGTWELHATTAQIEPFVLGGALPKFDADGRGRFTFNAKTHSATLQGELAGNVAALESIDPALRAMGAVRLQSEFDLAVEGDAARLNRLAVHLDGAEPVLALETMRPLVVNRRERSLQIASPGSGPLARLHIAQLPLAWVRPFVSAVDLSGGAVQGEWLLEGQGERVQLHSTAPLRADGVTVVQAGRRVLDRADVSANTEIVFEPTGATAHLADFALKTAAGDTLSGDFQFAQPKSSPAISVQGRVAGDLPRLLESYLPLGHVRLKSDIDATVSPALAELRSFHVELADANGRALLAVRSSNAASLDPRALQIKPAKGGDAELARVSLGAIDFGALPLVQSRLPLRGRLASGEFTVASQGGHLLVQPTAPLQIDDFTFLAETGQPRLDRVAIRTSPALDFTNLAEWKFSSGETTFANRDRAVWLSATAEASASRALGLRAGATFNADLAALAAQPPFVAAKTLASGRASGEIRGAIAGGEFQVEGRATLNNLVLREGNQPLPVANVSWRAARAADQRVTFEMPFLLDRLGQRSDLKISANAMRRAEGYVFDATVGGEHLDLGDALALLALAGAPVDAAAPDAKPATAIGAAPRATEPDARPFWRGMRGQLTLDIKSITRGKDWAMTGLSGAVAIEPQRAALKDFKGVINEKSRLAAKADLRFEGGAQPYRLAGDFSLNDFDAGAFLKAFDPGKPPVLEGIVTVSGNFTGDGANIDQTLDRTRGQFQLASRQGIFRGLKRTSEKVSVATKAIDAVSALGSLFGDKVKGVAEKVAPQAYQVDQLAQALGEIQFDQLAIRATRDNALNLRLDELTLLSPEVRLIGKGGVTNVPGKPLLEQPLSVSYSLAARGKVEQILGKMRVLDGTKDDLGYSKVKDTGTIGGTLSRPDPSQLFIKLAQSKLSDLLGN